MADNLTRNLDEQRRYYDSSIYAAFEYQKSRKNGESADMALADTILDDYLRSVIAGLRAKICQYEREARNADFVNKEALKRKIAVTRKQIHDLEEVINADIVTNPYAQGLLNHGDCPLFEEEIMASYTIFNEIKNHFINAESTDIDRLAILDRINSLESSILEPRMALATEEKELLDERTKKLSKAFHGVPLLPIQYVYKDLINAIYNNNYKDLVNFKNKIIERHFPQYGLGDDDPKDVFGYEMEMGTASTLKSKTSWFSKWTSFADFKIKEICNVLVRLEEVNEIKKILESLLKVLYGRDGKVIDGHSLDYSKAITNCADFIDFLTQLMLKYRRRLNLLKYDDLLQALENAKNLSKTKNRVGKLPPKFHSTYEGIKERSEETTPLEMKPETPEEENRRIIEEKKYSNEFLMAAMDDLKMFGSLDGDNLETLTPEELSKVIAHADKLKTLVGLDDNEKARIRASWPRTENGRLVISTEPSDAEISVQKVRDNMRQMYYRIETYAPRGEMKL